MSIVETPLLVTPIFGPSFPSLLIFPEKFYSSTNYLWFSNKKKIIPTLQKKVSKNYKNKHWEMFGEKGISWLTKDSSRFFFREKSLGSDHITPITSSTEEYPLRDSNDCQWTVRPKCASVPKKKKKTPRFGSRVEVGESFDGYCHEYEEAHCGNRSTKEKAQKFRKWRPKQMNPKEYIKLRRKSN